MQKRSNVGALAGGITEALCMSFLTVMLIFLVVKKRKKYSRVQSPNSTMLVHPTSRLDDPEVLKLTMRSRGIDLGEKSHVGSTIGSVGDGAQVIEARNLVILIQVLCNVTNHFSQKNVVKRGGFGVVYKGELDDGTKIAVKRMEASIISSKGLREFQSEISILTKSQSFSKDKSAIETRLAGTLSYLDPEYAIRGWVTTKFDVFRFGVVRMEPIIGRKALDETQSEESVHLVAWFCRMSSNKDNFRLAIDPTLDVTNESLQRTRVVGELAKHCTSREAWHCPDMSHVVNVLSILVEKWKPTDIEGDEGIRIDLDMMLPQALKRWQAYKGASVPWEAEMTLSKVLKRWHGYKGASVSSESGFFTRSDLDNTSNSMPSRPVRFAESFTSSDSGKEHMVRNPP
ncbi:hypothetical protein L7F22_035358 [Adiantum nelumboides]|nr:hypothetical protein [Adiantum nelumboides]